LDLNIEGLKNEYEFKLEIRSSQSQTSFNNSIQKPECWSKL